MRDIPESVRSSVRELEISNHLQNNCFDLMSHRTIYIPVDFGGLYQADMADVIKTDYNGNVCFICMEYLFSTGVDIDISKLSIPSDSGIIRIEKIEFINIDSEPV